MVGMAGVDRHQLREGGELALADLLRDVALHDEGTVAEAGVAVVASPEGLDRGGLGELGFDVHILSFCLALSHLDWCPAPRTWTRA